MRFLIPRSGGRGYTFVGVILVWRVGYFLLEVVVFVGGVERVGGELEWEMKRQYLRVVFGKVQAQGNPRGLPGRIYSNPGENCSMRSSCLEDCLVLQGVSAGMPPYL